MRSLILLLACLLIASAGPAAQTFISMTGSEAVRSRAMDDGAAPCGVGSLTFAGPPEACADCAPGRWVHTPAAAPGSAEDRANQCLLAWWRSQRDPLFRMTSLPAAERSRLTDARDNPSIVDPTRVVAPPPRLLSHQERAACLAEGGRVGIAGLAGGQMCVRRASDAGRSCTGSEQCEGFCEYRHRERGPVPQPGARVAGQCQAEIYLFGCRSTVEGGVLQAGLCID